MRKNKLILSILIMGILLLAGCGNSTGNTSSSQKQLESDEDTIPENIQTKSNALSSNADVIAYKSQCTTITNYSDLARYADDYLNNNVSVHVEISQILEDGNVIRGYDDANNDGFYMDNEYLIIDDREFDTTKLLEGDVIVVYGLFSGTEKVTRAINNVEEEIPCIEMYVADIDGVEPKGTTDIDTSFWLGDYCRNGDSNDCGIYVYETNTNYIAFSIGDGIEFDEREIVADLDSSGYTATYTDDFHSYSLVYNVDNQTIDVTMKIVDKSLYTVDATGSYSILEENYEIDTGEYIFPDSDQFEIYENELTDLSNWELRVARNEILARHGRKFSDHDLQDYFDSCSWYSGTVEPDDFDESILNDIEKSNISVIKRVEDSRK